MELHRILPDDITTDHVAIELNTDFSTASLTAPEITALVAAWQAGAVSQDTILDLFRPSDYADNRIMPCWAARSAVLLGRGLPARGIIRCDFYSPLRKLSRRSPGR